MLLALVFRLRIAKRAKEKGRTTSDTTWTNRSSVCCMVPCLQQMTAAATTIATPSSFSSSHDVVVSFIHKRTGSDAVQEFILIDLSRTFTCKTTTGDKIKFLRHCCCCSCCCRQPIQLTPHQPKQSQASRHFGTLGTR